MAPADRTLQPTLVYGAETRYARKVSFHLSGPKENPALVVTDNGVGPAIITSCEILLDGHTVQGIQELDIWNKLIGTS